MAKEAEGVGIPFTDIHINLQDQTITLKKKMKLSQHSYLKGNCPLQVLFSSQTSCKLYLPALKGSRKQLSRSPLMQPKSGK
jgi:hypothetical protein